MSTRIGPPDTATTPADRYFDRALLAATLIAAGFAFSLLRAEPDLWGHVQYGRDVLAEGLPATTSYSFTAEGYRWINHENLSELLFAWCVDHLGVWSLLAGKCLLGLAIMGGMLWHARQRHVTPLVSAAALLLVAVNLTGFWHVRPQVLSYGLFALLLGLLSFSFAGWQEDWHLPWCKKLARSELSAESTFDRRRMVCLWSAAVLFVVWVNTHGAFLAGLSIFLAYIFLRAAEFALARDRQTRGLPALLGLLGLAVAGATLLNPYGPELHRWLLQSLTIPRPEITEWHALRWGDEPLLPFAILVVAAGSGLLFSRRSLDATQLVILLLALWQALSHQRHVPFFVILCGFWLPPHWQSAAERWRAVRPAGAEMSAGAKRLAAAGLVLVSVLIASLLVGRWRQLPVERSRFPVSALEFLHRQQLTGRLVVTYNWAQYAIAAVGTNSADEPGIRVGFDGRFRTCYPLDLVDQHFDFILGCHPRMPRYRSPQSPPAEPAALLERGQPDLVLISRRQPHSVRVMQDHQDCWSLLYQDQLAQLWVEVQGMTIRRWAAIFRQRGDRFRISLRRARSPGRPFPVRERVSLSNMHPAQPTETESLADSDVPVTWPNLPASSNHAQAGESVSSAEAVYRLEEATDQLDQLQQLLRDELGDAGSDLPQEINQDICLSVVIPVYNERDTIRPLLARVGELPMTHEIVVVDDCSTDGTSEVLRSLPATPGLRILYKSRNEGKGAALQSGFEWVAGEIVVIQDADLEYDPRDIPQLVAPILKGQADVVYGSRFLNHHHHRGSSWIHQAGNHCLTAASNALTGLSLTDMETCYKVFRRSVLDGLQLKENRFGFEPEFTAKIARRGLRIRELPIGYRARDWNQGKKIGLLDAVNAIYCIARYAWCD